MNLRSEIVVSALSLAVGLAAPGCSDGRTSHRVGGSRHNDLMPDQCPPEGTAHDPVGQALNDLKNRAIAPTTIDPNVTLAAMLADGGDTNRFRSEQAATVAGYVVKVMQGGHPESANCGNLSKRYTDTHIQIGLTPTAPDSQTVVVEVTPHWRETMKAQGVDWGTDTLKASITGHWVQVTGWLMFDTAHAMESTNSNTPGVSAWRKTAWEVHPITAMVVDAPH